MVERKDVLNAIQLANSYIDRLYKRITPDHGVVAEYPSIPFSIKVRVTPEKFHPAGGGTPYCDGRFWWRHSKFKNIDDAGSEEAYTVGGFIGFEETSYEEAIDQDCDEPLIHFTYTAIATEGGKTKLTARVVSYGGERTVDVYCGKDLIWECVSKDNIPTTEFSRETEPYGFFPSHRYVLVPTQYLAWKHYWFNSTHPEWKSRALKIVSLLDDFGYNKERYDIFDPLFGMSKEATIRDLWRARLYDLSVYHTLPRGIDYFPYRSAASVQAAKNPEAFFINTFKDPVCLCMYAIHNMNRFGSPDTRDEYNNCARDYLFYGVYDPEGELWAPATWYAVPMYGYPYQTGLQTGTFWGALLAGTSELGYGFDDQESKRWADLVFDHLVNPRVVTGRAGFQWRGDGTDQTYDLGKVYRPDHRGGFTIAKEYTAHVTPSYWRVPPYKNLVRASFGMWTNPEFPELGPLNPVLDMFNMPPEFPSLIPTNAESTLVCARALMIYEAYKYRGLKGPIPRLLIREDVDFNGTVELYDLSYVGKRCEASPKRYPIYENIKPHYYAVLENRMSGTEAVTPATGKMEHVRLLLHVYETCKVKCAIYNQAGELIGTTEERVISEFPYKKWEGFKFLDPKPTLQEGQRYSIVAWANGECYLMFSPSMLGKKYIWRSRTYDAFPSKFAFFSMEKYEGGIDGLITTYPAYDPKADINGDGIVDLADVELVERAMYRTDEPPPRKITVRVPTMKTIQSSVLGFANTLAAAAMIDIVRRAYKAWKR